MNATIIILLVVFAAAVIVLLIILIMSQRTTASRFDEIRRSQSENQALVLLQQQVGQLTQNVNQQLDRFSDRFQKTTSDIGQTLGNVKQDLGRMENVTKEVLEKAKDISTLEDLLRAPKFRGGLGEFFLGDLLAQIFPPAHFTLQHRFKSGEKVDAALKIGSSLVPIDAKFPLENFKKYIQAEEGKDKENQRKKFSADVKKHIDDIATKYILPDEGTYEFALMYIPAENIYYETIIRDELLGDDKSIFSFALKKKVIPVSPNSFFAYLQVIVLGLKGLQIEESAQEIFRSLAQLQGDLARFRTDFQTLGTHLGNARGKFDEAEKRLEKFSGRLELVQGAGTPELPGKDSGE